MQRSANLPENTKRKPGDWRSDQSTRRRISYRKFDEAIPVAVNVNACRPHAASTMITIELTHMYVACAPRERSTRRVNASFLIRMPNIQLESDFLTFPIRYFRVLSPTSNAIDASRFCRDRLAKSKFSTPARLYFFRAGRKMEIERKRERRESYRKFVDILTDSASGGFRLATLSLSSFHPFRSPTTARNAVVRAPMIY